MPIPVYVPEHVFQSIRKHPIERRARDQAEVATIIVHEFFTPSERSKKDKETGRKGKGKAASSTKGGTNAEGNGTLFPEAYVVSMFVRTVLEKGIEGVVALAHLEMVCLICKSTIY